MRNLISIFFLSLLLAILLVSGCGQQAAQQDNGSATAQESSATGVGTDVGDTPPEFSLVKVGGGNLDLADLKGQVVLLDFWDTWCPPCREALPHLQELSVEHPDGFTVVGVALGNEGAAKVKGYVEKHGFTFPFVFGGEEVFVKYGVQSLPTTFLLDAQGVIRHKWIGGQPKAEYERQIKKILG